MKYYVFRFCLFSKTPEVTNQMGSMVFKWKQQKRNKTRKIPFRNEQMTCMGTGLRDFLRDETHQ